MIFALAIVLAPAAQATVNITSGPTSLVPDPILVKAASPPVPLLAFTLSQDAGENLTSVSVLVNQNATTTVSGADLANVAVYKDNGDGVFSTVSDVIEGTQTTVNVGSNTTVAMATTTLATGKFFVTLATSTSWSGAAPADSVTVTLPVGQIALSAGSVSYSALTTNSITADTTGPVLLSAVAKNTGGTGQKEAGDTIELTFSDSTNKPIITNANIASYFTLNNGHSFLDLGGNLGAATWNVAGTVLSVALSGTTTPSSTIATVAVGDTVTVIGTGIQDLAGNLGTGSQIITGTFGGQTSEGDDRDDEGEEHEGRGICGNGLTNGQLYQISGSPTIYLAAACRLKPFRGEAVFHARGKKFQNITVLPSLPAGVTISGHPVLPGAGALIKGHDKTVWFVTKDGKRKGFTSADVFHALGFDFKQVKEISDQDLSTIPADSPINNVVSHPEGALIKCGTSATVFEVVGNEKFPFTSADAFLSRGHSWDNIVVVDCGKFSYIVGAVVNN